MSITRDVRKGTWGLKREGVRLPPFVPVSSLSFPSVPMRCRVAALEMGQCFLTLWFCSSVLFLGSSMEPSGLVLWEGFPGEGATCVGKILQ